MKNSSLLPSETVAVVVPLSDRTDLTSDEEVSLRHLNHFLSRYDKYMLAPEGLHVEYKGFEIKHFDPACFGSASAHSKLVVSTQLYETFVNYKFILLYHLDALVFSDQLLEWCDADFDYIGAPWISHKNAPYHGKPMYEGKVGNGGLSLRKVTSVLEVLKSSRRYREPDLYGTAPATMKFGCAWWWRWAKCVVKDLKGQNDVKWELSRWRANDDAFWANRAKYYYPEFKLAPVETALRFAFECVPRYCFELTQHTLPFGCHAWQRYDREFWQPFLLK